MVNKLIEISLRNRLERKVLDNSMIDFDQVVSSTKTKLLLWGMNENQVNGLSTGSKDILTTTVYSNENGYITELNIQEGEYVNEGGEILKLADLSKSLGRGTNIYKPIYFA